MLFRSIATIYIQGLFSWFILGEREVRMYLGFGFLVRVLVSLLLNHVNSYVLCFCVCSLSLIFNLAQRVNLHNIVLV